MIFTLQACIKLIKHVISSFNSKVELHNSQYIILSVWISQPYITCDNNHFDITTTCNILTNFPTHRVSRLLKPFLCPCQLLLLFLLDSFCSPITALVLKNTGTVDRKKH